METPVTGATPAATPAAPVTAQAALDSLNTDERTKWEQTGDLPERIAVGSKTSDVSAASSTASTESPESSPATPVEQAASTDATVAAASEPAKPAEKPPKEKGAKARSAELDAEIAELREKLRIRAALREELGRETPRTTQPASEPAKAPTQAEWKRFAAMPEAPKVDDFERIEDHTAAMALFIADKRLEEHQGRARAEASFTAEVQRVEGVAKEATARIQEYAKEHPDFEAKVDPELLNVPTASVRRLQRQKVGPQHVLAEEILKSPVTGPLLEHFSSPEGQAEWAQLCALPYGDLLRAFGRVEARMHQSGPAAPAPKTVSEAPVPPITLGTRTADTADPEVAAVKAKDFTRFQREANKRDLARLAG